MPIVKMDSAKNDYCRIAENEMKGFCIQESTLDPADARHRATVKAGDYWLFEVKKNEVLRIVDLEGNQAVDTLFFDASDPHDRYSAVDTLRAQGNVYLTVGSKLLADSGNVLVEITADTCGRHDTLGGACAAES
ncbi:MAG: urea carboxylase-associated family protein, partial [Moraxellaceae bacterium]|nr:urea carboxylase-associated family protein [Moraxellaceae bacterium]